MSTIIREPETPASVQHRPQIRQGDVLLSPVADPDLAAIARSLDPSGQPLAGLLVAGERTGHHHQLPARVYDHTGGGRMLLLERPATLTHEEHPHVEVPAGWWEVRIQREHVPQSGSVGRYD